MGHGHGRDFRYRSESRDSSRKENPLKNNIHRLAIFTSVFILQLDILHAEQVSIKPALTSGFDHVGLSVLKY